MEDVLYKTMDKSDWDSGPWQDEPDKMQWTDEATGLPCLIVRNRLGALCGYVGVSEGHPAFEKDYDHLSDPWPDVHGGLTYAAFCQEGDEEKSICHVPAPEEPDRVWWFGFDCAHGGDVVPGMEARERERGWPTFHEPYAAYRTVDYVKGECAGLARQLTAMA